MGIVRAVCISREKGTPKEKTAKAKFIENFGIEGDAHAGNWHRQVSLLSLDKVEKFCEGKIDIPAGAFGENLLVSGIDFKAFPVGTRFKCNDVLLEITQIGKECHSHCAIYEKIGDCIMPREGVFARVLKGGWIYEGDVLQQEKGNPQDRTIGTKETVRAAVITISDRCYANVAKDLSGPLLKEILSNSGYKVAEALILPDEREMIERELISLSDETDIELIITTGGTGFAPRDVTPEATLAVATRNAPGISEAIRASSMKYTGRAMLSRGASVIRDNTLIINLPGSPKALKEGLEAVLPYLEHGIKMLRGGNHEGN
ncbi:MAG: molybdenum cofactor biosynthesis protein [Lachnospiraceae bacterium]|jgi:molybdenum cofactor synthesis domain-containing protein|nr:molybdenum cofactor biosynthesis protein [Lachnospiraceae bacterium]